MRWFRVVGVTIILLVTIFALIGTVLPTQYTVERSVVINANSEHIHEYVGNLKNWEDWTPWKESDPSVEITFGDKIEGVGASQSWVGDSGDGSLTFKKSSPEKGIEYDLYFDANKYKSSVSIQYKQKGEATEVIWTMRGDMEAPVIGGYFAVMMDSMAGGMFEHGLATLKRKVEN